MEFSAKYVSEAEQLKPENKGKIIISDESFAIGEVIQALIDKIEHTRVSLE